MRNPIHRQPTPATDFDPAPIRASIKAAQQVRNQAERMLRENQARAVILNRNINAVNRRLDDAISSLIELLESERKRD